jgi:hypothetical protein
MKNAIMEVPHKNLQKRREGISGDVLNNSPSSSEGSLDDSMN